MQKLKYLLTIVLGVLITLSIMLGLLIGAVYQEQVKQELIMQELTAGGIND